MFRKPIEVKHWRCTPEFEYGAATRELYHMQKKRAQAIATGNADIAAVFDEEIAMIEKGIEKRRVRLFEVA